ncbi:MAG TPA: biotin--[acetyl-CoA-carboxylase] ligase [Ruminococcus sp.]|nr:biotin--[acetyl-CoA-carboxylase] ligase [Ruminococcus sp.]
MILYRPVGSGELELIAASGWRTFPPRLPEQPIFYPVLTASYACEIAEQWNTKESDGSGWVVCFSVDDAYISRYPVQTAGGSAHRELWIPSEELAELNTHIQGQIEPVMQVTAADAALANEIAAQSGTPAPLHIYSSVTSTNDLLRSMAEAGAPAFTVIASRRQTAGKGRQGRSFYSPAHTGLYLSMLLRPQMTPQELMRITPMAAVAAAEAAEQVSGVRTEIKWVNDLLLRGKKICGILAEAQTASAQPEYVIVGIGINLTEPENGFPPELREIAGALLPADADAEAAFVKTAEALTAALLRQYAGIMERAYLRGYRERLCVLGKAVTVNENGTEREASALAVDDDLRLLVRYEDGTEQWRSTGEIRIRLK